MSHSERIIDQFTRMADAFATAPHILDQDALDLLLRAYFRPSRTAFQADRGRQFSVIADGVSD